jgi:UDPglucose 6-dehydrogenase
MKVGFVGLGKLGLPCALAMENKGHEIIGFDISESVREIIKTKKIPYKEEGTQPLLAKTKLKLVDSVEEVVKQTDLIFVPIQTPHDPRFEGITRIPEDRANFNYDFLKAGIRDITNSATILRKHVTVVIISTVLPGTIEREIKPILTEFVHLVYNPYFIAMGTTRADFEKPEFVLLGSDDDAAAEAVVQCYKSIHDRPIFRTTIKTAELIKVAYNTFIGFKITFINAMMEICHKTGADIDDLSQALSLATDRIISPKYMQGGMGDGGGCHPRDNIALSWLAKELKLSHDIFEDLMLAREDQTDWLVDLIEEKQKSSGLMVYILGKSYKPESNLTVGSPAILLANLLEERKIPFKHVDPFVDDIPYMDYEVPAIYFIATKHESFKDWQFSKGDIIIDPFGYLEPQEGVTVHQIGRKTLFLSEKINFDEDESEKMFKKPNQIL